MELTLAFTWLGILLLVCGGGTAVSVVTRPWDSEQDAFGALLIALMMCSIGCAFLLWSVAS